MASKKGLIERNARLEEIISRQQGALMAAAGRTILGHNLLRETMENHQAWMLFVDVDETKSMKVLSRDLSDIKPGLKLSLEELNSAYSEVRGDLFDVITEPNARTLIRLNAIPGVGVDAEGFEGALDICQATGQIAFTQLDMYKITVVDEILEARGITEPQL